MTDIETATGSRRAKSIRESTTDEYICSWINEDVAIANRNLAALCACYSELNGVQGLESSNGKHPLDLDPPFSPEATLKEPEMTEDTDLSPFESSTILNSPSCSGHTYIASPTESRRCEITLLAVLSSERLRPVTVHSFHGYKDSIFVVCRRLLHFSQGGYGIGRGELETHERTVTEIASQFVDFERKIKEQRAVVADMPSRMIFTVAAHDDNVFVVWKLRSQTVEKNLTLPLVEEDRLLEAFHSYFNACLYLPLTKLRSIDRNPIRSLLSSLERLAYAITTCTENYSDLRKDVKNLRRTYLDPLAVKIWSSSKAQKEITKTKQTLDNADRALPPRYQQTQKVRRRSLTVRAPNLRGIGVNESVKSRRLRKEQTV